MRPLWSNGFAPEYVKCIAPKYLVKIHQKSNVSMEKYVNFKKYKQI